MLFSTSLVALVTSPRRLQIYNMKRHSSICELTFPTTVLAVRLNRKRLVVTLEDQIYLYDVSNMKLLQTITTSPNPNAICALAPSSDNCFLAYPFPNREQRNTQLPAHVPNNHVPPTSGDVLIYDTIKQQQICAIQAHRSPLSCITLNANGTLLATASDKGTIIRVFGLPSAQKLYQFRRGSMPASIYSMSFNAASTLLCVSSASETVHIFKLSSYGTSSDAAGSRRRYSSISGQDTPSPAVDARIRDRSLSPGNEPDAGNDSDTNSLSIASHSRSNSFNNPTSSPPKTRSPNGTLLGLLRRTGQNVGASLATSVGAYLPSAVSEMWEPSRDFAWLKIPKRDPNTSSSSAAGASPHALYDPSAQPAIAGGPAGAAHTTTSGMPGVRSVVAMSGSSPHVMVVTNEGRYMVFGIDLEKGGEGSLLKVYEVGGGGEGLGAGNGLGGDGSGRADSGAGGGDEYF